jgi:hypothetical protein
MVGSKHSVVSFVCVLASAAASLGTSDTSTHNPSFETPRSIVANSEHEVTIHPEDSEVSVALRIDVKLDPPPLRSEALDRTPIVLLMEPPSEPLDASNSSPMLPIPSGSAPDQDGFESISSAVISRTDSVQSFVLTFAWPSAEVSGTVRPFAPREDTTIYVRAVLEGDSYDAFPSGSDVSVTFEP